MGEVFLGEYGAGKSEVSAGRAILLAGRGLPVTVADLDLTDPVFRISQAAEKLAAYGVKVIGWPERYPPGMGEAGNVLFPGLLGIGWLSGEIIIDVGYGTESHRLLNLIPGLAALNPLFYFVINCRQPLTATVPGIIEAARRVPGIHGFVNNTHLGKDTDLDLIKSGAEKIEEASAATGIPYIATASFKPLAAEMEQTDYKWHEIWPLYGLVHGSFPIK
ncbi:MAG: hypothetical protein M1379_10815 [Firmicutes bacterium]|nr:hypothetical protein [Bacillota bacterium]